MPKSCDIFLSHSGAQKVFVRQLREELTRAYGHYSVFYDEESIKHGDSIRSSIVENAKTCKLAVAVISEEYFTKSKPPMLELAASYTASIENGNGVPCLLPVFLDLKPEDAKDVNRQKLWEITWAEWSRNERMSDRTEPRTNTPVELTVWKEAIYKLLGARGLTYKPNEFNGNSSLFAKYVAREIASTLGGSSKTMVPYKAMGSVQQYKGTDLSDSVGRLNVSPNSPQSSDQGERASTSGETHMEFECSSCLELKRKVEELQRNVRELEGKVKEREMYLQELESKVNTSGASFRKFRFCPRLWWEFKTPIMPTATVGPK